jgi:dihydropteroate synthase
MGILNVTPDSFSDGGRYLDRGAAVERALSMVREGADIVDVGGESTRPGSGSVPEALQVERAVPVIEGIRAREDVLVSIDTTRASVASAAIEAGARIVNDTSALADDPGMADVVRESGAAVVLMHRKGVPSTMQDSPRYEAFLPELLDSLRESVVAATRAGIPADRILVDPGVGFGKRFEDNLSIHRGLSTLHSLGVPVLFASSRKSFLGKISGKPPGDRLFGTLASNVIAACQGAHVLRVHDVAAVREAVDVVAAVFRPWEERWS